MSEEREGETDHKAAELEAPGSESRNGGVPNAELYRGRPSWLNYWRSIFFATVAVVAGVVFWERNGWILFGGLLYALAVYGYICASRAMWLYLVTSKRVEVIHGLITKNSNEVRVKDIRAINVKKEGFKGFLGVGTVEFASAGSDEAEVKFGDIWGALRVKGIVRELQDEGDGE